MHSNFYPLPIPLQTSLAFIVLLHRSNFMISLGGAFVGTSSPEDEARVLLSKVRDVVAYEHYTRGKTLLRFLLEASCPFFPHLVKYFLLGTSRH